MTSLREVGVTYVVRTTVEILDVGVHHHSYHKTALGGETGRRHGNV